MSESLFKHFFSTIAYSFSLSSNVRMSELNDNSSDDDVFVIKHVKPVNKLTFRQALIIKHTVLKSFKSEEDKKKKKKKEKKKDDSLSSKLKGSKSKESISPSVSNKSGIFDCVVKKTKQNDKLKGIKRESNTQKSHSKQIPESNGTKSSLAKSSKSKDLSERQGNKLQNAGKRVELRPENLQRQKRFKDCAEDVELLETNRPEENKPLGDSCPKVSNDELILNKTVKSESASDLSQSSVTSSFKENNENFEKSLLSFSFEGDSWNFSEEKGEKLIGYDNDLLPFSFKKIISDETKKQIELEQESIKNGRQIEKLFSKFDSEVFEKFFCLDNKTCKLFVRMLKRKRHWHRVSNIVYEDIDKHLEKYFQILKEINFVDDEIENEDVVTQLNLLYRAEVMTLCKTFNVLCKTQGSAKKEVLIKALVEDCKKQKSVLDFAKGSGTTHRLKLLKSELNKILGMCIRIKEETFKVFNKVLILFSFAHFYDEEEKRFNNELYTYIKVYRNIIKYPKYKLSPTVVFETLADFEEYEKSLTLLNDFERAVANKNHDKFLETVAEVKKNFENLLGNQKYCERVLSLPSFLKKFSGGTTYARILTNYCQTFKSITDQSDIIKTIRLLLDQSVFLQRKRGIWYDVLCKALEKIKKNDETARVLVEALKDPFVNEIQRLSLQLRGQGVLKKRSNGVSDAGLREELNDLCVIEIAEPCSIEIKGKALEGNESRGKSVYVQITENGKKYTSVEERAILHYKSHGFTKGYHVEGFIIHTIYFLLFFDIIYGDAPKGVFQSPYQEIPLDFHSSSFYLNRKDEIDKFLADMVTWDVEKVENKIKDVYWKNFDTVCVINWEREFTPELFCEVIQCITMPILVQILKRLVGNFGVYRSGFPDLTLWNPETSKIIFVEVKSPNDKLSPRQKIWLHFLRSIGLSSEVCNVRNTSGKNFE